MQDSKIPHNHPQDEIGNTHLESSQSAGNPYTKWLQLAAKHCNGFAGKRVLDVGCDLTGVTVQELIEQYGVVEAVGLNLAIEPQAISQNGRLERGDICETFYPDNYFDVILSISAFEHIQNFEVALQEMHRILKPGGRLYADFSPIWSASYGHHLWLSFSGELYNYWNVMLPPYCHLLMTEEEVFDWCSQRFDTDLSQAITNFVFHSADQNRLFFEDYLNLIDQSDFEVFLWKGYQLELGDRYQQCVTPELSEQLHQKFSNQDGFLYEGIEVLLQKKSADLLPSEQPKNQHKVLFFSPFGEWLVHSQVDAVLALRLRQQGEEVLVIGCDGLYQDCIVTSRADKYSIDASVLCQRCAQSGRQFFNSFNLPHIQFNKYIIPEDYEVAHQWVETVDPRHYADATYQDLAIGEWVTSSVNSYFRLSSVRELLKPEVQEVHRKYLIDGLVTYLAFSRLLDTYQPTNLIIFNSRLTPYRIAFEVARQRQIDVITHERGFIDDSFSFFDNTHCLSPKSAEACVDDWQNIPRLPSELSEVSEYFKQREAGSGLNWKPFFDFQTDYGKVRQKLNIPQKAKIVTVFTSSPDELAAFNEYEGITEQLELIDRLIQVFANREEYLIIRHHPWIGGNAFHPANMDFLTLAYQQARSVPKNVRIVMPNEQITSYALLWNTDAAIAFFSTVAIEAVARGVATAPLESSPYRKAFHQLISTSDVEPSSLHQLIDVLLSESVFSAAESYIEILRKLYRFTDAYFFRFSRRFNSFGIKDYHSPDIRFQSLEELRPGVDLTLDQVCDRVIYKTSLHELPSSDRRNDSTSEEDTFLQKELAEILKIRQVVHEKSEQELSKNTAISVGVICLQYNDSRHSDSDNNDEILSSWIEHSRHHRITLHPCQVSSKWEDHIATVNTILQCLKSCSEQYFLVTEPHIQYDESFLSIALEQLTAEDNSDIQGVLAGAWITDSAQQQITHSVFTPAHPCKTYRDAAQVLVSVQHPISLLAFTLLDKRLLVKLLNTIRQISSLTAAAESLFLMLSAPVVSRLEVPMMVIYSNSEMQTRDLRLKPLRLEYDLGRASQQLRERQAELERSQAQLQASQTELEQYQTALKAAQVEGGRFLYELQAAQAEMERLQATLYQMQGALEATNNKLARTENRLNTKEKTLKKVQNNLKKLRENLRQTQETVTAMESSKFWKLRGKWIKLKKIFRLDSD
ncbi:MAG: methyltransferase domain-containing protein [Oculatellaceae cyanobacterium bins.114]|nr:methyltransferase domain-containing protein [Oculatellaceae cyanobacterium bins.114]